MPFEQLHKNSGAKTRNWKIKRLYLSLSVAEDPKLRFWARLSDDKMTRTIHLIGINRVQKETQDGKIISSLNFIVGRYSLSAAIIPISS